ncbi:MAG: cystathionine gamma-synthase, partial [Boseongicola sp.]|nr:cystathionine gamma-synthase [Boseongicola sp.]
MSDTPSKPFRAPWPSSLSRPVVNPLQPSVVYASGDPDELDAQYEGGAKGYTYAREGHPNSEVLGQMVDAMEGATRGVV